MHLARSSREPPANKLRQIKKTILYNLTDYQYFICTPFAIFLLSVNIYTNLRKNYLHIFTFCVYFCDCCHTGSRKSRLLFTYNLIQPMIMSDTDMIRGIVKNILKPIIAEAIQEVGVETTQKSEKRYYTREEACQHLKIGTTTFYRLVKKGKLQLLKIAGKTLVDADDLDEAIETRQVFRYQH